MAFRLTAFAEKAHIPHGQMIHIGPVRGELSNVCHEWVVLDFESAWSVKYGKVIMNWPTTSKSDNVHWEWECDGRVSR